MEHALRSLECRVCGREIAAVTTNTAPLAPKSVNHCLRRCACGKGGYSNARNQPTWIFTEPTENVPAEVRAGLDEALTASLNRRSQKTKRFRFGFETSEDAVTWTVFRYLQKAGRIRQHLAACGNNVATQATTEPSLLLWGSPVPSSDERGREVRSNLIEVLGATLNERKASFSEPDVILDFGTAGIVIIEAKYRSGNDRKPTGYGGWLQYLDDSEAFRDPQAVKASGLYELARNWRIGWELARDGPGSLLNLGPSSLLVENRDLVTFGAALATGPKKQFQVITWARLLSNEVPAWLQTWLERKRDLGLHL